MQVNLTPDVAARALAYLLARYRQAAGKSQDEAGEWLDRKQSTIANFENGRNPPTPGNLLSLLEFYGRGNQYPMLRPLRDVSARRNRKDQASIGLVSDLGLRLGLEWLARSAESYMPVIVDGLLQIEAYARWIIESGSSQVGLNVDETLQLRMDRQAVLYRKLAADQHLPPMHLRMYIQESALRREIGGPKVLAEQLDFLTDQSARRNIDILVVPDSIIYHRAMRGPVTVLSFEDDLKIGCTEDFHSSHYLDSPGALDNAARLMTELHSLALDQEESRRLISSIREELGTP